MRKLAILPLALEGYVSREFWQMVCVLAADYGWNVMDCNGLPDRDLPQILSRRFGTVPEVVLFRESYGAVARHAGSLRDGGTRIYVMTEDIHHRFDGMDEAFRAATAVLSPYAPRLKELLPGHDDLQPVWVPHAAGPDFLLPVAERPENMVFVSGMMDRQYYPLRVTMRDLVQRRPQLGRIHHHPGYHCSFHYGRDPRVGRGYAEAIRQCLAGFTDAARCLYVLAKHFEIPATGALLIAERSIAPQLATLGFADGVHYVSATEDDLEQVVEDVLDDRNRPEIDAIRRRGHALVHERHRTRDRAHQIDTICA